MLLIAGISLVVLGSIMLARAFTFSKKFSRTKALVVRVEEISRQGNKLKEYAPVVSFTDQAGLPIISKLSGSFSDATVHEGDYLLILYSKENPRVVLVGQPRLTNLGHWMVIVTGIILCLVHFSYRS